jgi:hypothetical protein
MLSNLLARSFIIFILAYLWLGFYIDNILIVFLVSFLVMFGVNYLIILFYKKKNIKIKFTRKQHEDIRRVILQFKFMSKTEVRAFLKKALSKLDKKVRYFYPLFDTAVTCQDIIKCIKKTPSESTAHIMAESFTDEVVVFADALQRKTVLLDACAVYTRILEPAQTFPDVKAEFKTRKKLTWADLRRTVFQRSKIRPYITIGIIILLTSFIVKFSFLYVFFASLIFSFALISLVAVESENECF